MLKRIITIIRHTPTNLNPGVGIVIPNAETIAAHNAVRRMNTTYGR